MKSLPDWDAVCRRITDKEGMERCKRELEGLDLSELAEETPAPFLQTDAGHVALTALAVVIGLWAYSRIKPKT